VEEADAPKGEVMGEPESDSTRHGQKALTDAVAQAIDRTIKEWDITPNEIVGVLHSLATGITVRVMNGTFGQDDT
jgi:hypothetical protein